MGLYCVFDGLSRAGVGVAGPASAELLSGTCPTPTVCNSASCVLRHVSEPACDRARPQILRTCVCARALARCGGTSLNAVAFCATKSFQRLFRPSAFGRTPEGRQVGARRKAHADLISPVHCLCRNEVLRAELPHCTSKLSLGVEATRASLCFAQLALCFVPEREISCREDWHSDSVVS